MSVITAVDPSMDGALDQITNESGSPPPSPPSATAKMGPVLRHKSTHRDLNPDLDSSESCPSPHSSIYEASLIHQSGEKGDSIPPYTTDDGLPPWNNIVSDASGNPVLVCFLQTPPNKNTSCASRAVSDNGKKLPCYNPSIIVSQRPRVGIHSTTTQSRPQW